MGRPKKIVPSEDIALDVRPMPPARTAEGRENQLIALAYDLVEKRLREGTATSQETTHFLKMGSAKERKELAILDKQEKLLAAKTEALESTKRIEELYANALQAMRSYSGESSDDNTEENGED